MSDIKERLYLVMEQLGLNDYKVYTNIESITKNMMSKLRSGGTGEVSTKIIAPFCSYYEEANPDYILTGRGEPLKTPSVTRIDHPKGLEKIIPNQDVILYDISAAANLRTLLGDKTQNIIGKISLPNIPKCDGAVYIKGDSMYPLLKAGDIVAYKEIHNFENVVKGEMYLVSFEMEGDEYLTVKYVNKSDKPGHIKLVSYNPHHDPMDIPIVSINAMALIKVSIRMNTMS